MWTLAAMHFTLWMCALSVCSPLSLSHSLPHMFSLEFPLGNDFISHTQANMHWHKLYGWKQYPLLQDTASFVPLFVGGNTVLRVTAKELRGPTRRRGKDEAMGILSPAPGLLCSSFTLNGPDTSNGNSEPCPKPALLFLYLNGPDTSQKPSLWPGVWAPCGQSSQQSPLRM